LTPQNRAGGWRGHLTFHLKHEVLHLELLSRLFEQLYQIELVDWIQQEPSGQYARKAGFLYEWFTGRELEITAAIQPLEICRGRFWADLQHCSSLDCANHRCLWERWCAFRRWFTTWHHRPMN